jgi:hypothetical protein
LLDCMHQTPSILNEKNAQHWQKANGYMLFMLWSCLHSNSLQSPKKQTNKASNQASKKGETITDRINRVSVCYHALYQSPSFNPERGKEGKHQMHPHCFHGWTEKQQKKEGWVGGAAWEGKLKRHAGRYVWWDVVKQTSCRWDFWRRRKPKKA